LSMSPGSQQKGSSSELHHDQPIKNAKDDLFGWDDLAKRLGDALTLTSEDPIVIGLYGAWGSGKSSLMNMVAESLEARPPIVSGDPQAAERSASDPELQRILGGETIGRPPPVSPLVPACVIVRFNPWYFKGEEALIQAFFQELGAAIGQSSIPFAGQIVEAIKKYSAWLIPVATVATVAAGMAVGGPLGAALGAAVADGAKQTYELAKGTREAVSETPPSLSEQRERLRALLRAAKVRIVVLIDDIDRLYADDVLTMMKLVRLVGDLPYVSYLLGFDPEVVAGCLAKAGPQTNGHELGKEYLAKIVQMSVQVPTPRVDLICEYTLDQLGSIVYENYGHGEAGRHMEQLDSEWRLVFGYRVSDVRQAKRIVNAVRVAMPLVKGKCNPVDLVLVEALRVYSPAHFAWLRLKSDLVIGRSVQVDKNQPTNIDSPILDSLKAHSLIETPQYNALIDLLELIRTNYALTLRQFYMDRFASLSSLRRVLNLGTDASTVSFWRDHSSPINHRASISPAIQAQAYFDTVVRESGSWLAAIHRIRLESSNYDGAAAECILQIILDQSKHGLQESGGGRGVSPETAVAQACVGLLLRKPDLKPENWMKASTSVALLGEIEDRITKENERLRLISQYGDTSIGAQGPLEQIRRQYPEALQRHIRGLSGLESWLSERPSPRLRAILSRRMGWHGSDATQRARILSQLDQCSRDGLTGAQLVIRVFFTNLEHTGKSAPINSYHQLQDFIDPQEIAKRLGPAPTPQRLADEELTALLASEETPERALKLFFHAHLLANPPA
jgi:hypothetical protein